MKISADRLKDSTSPTLTLKEQPMITDSPIVKRMFELGEEQVGKVAQQLLDNDAFASAVQAVVNNSLKAKGALDKQVRVVLSAMSLPTTEDVDNLKAKLESLEASIDRIEKAVDKLAAAKESEDGSGNDSMN